MIRINEKVKNQIAAHGQSTYPYECCGFVFGDENNDVRLLHSLLEVTNSHEGDHRRRFQIDPKDYLKAEKYADENNITFLGIYHSHPDHPSIPSEHDRVQAMPFFSYLILSVRDGKAESLQSWRLNNEFQFTEEKIKLNK